MAQRDKKLGFISASHVLSIGHNRETSSLHTVMGRTAIYNTIAAKKEARRKRDRLKPQTKENKERRKIRKKERLDEIRKNKKEQEERDRLNQQVEALLNRGIFVRLECDELTCRGKR